MENIWRKTASRWSKENIMQWYNVTLILTAEEFMDLVRASWID